MPLEGPAYLHALLPGPLKDVKKLEKKVIDGKLGKLECRGLTGATEFKRGDDDASVIYETRLHEKAPFGVVSCSMEVEFERDGQERGSLTETLKLTDFGKTALTELPNHN